MKLCRLRKVNCLQTSTFVGILLVCLIFKYVAFSKDGFTRNIFGKSERDEIDYMEPISVVLVMTSQEDTKHLPMQLKGILYYRSSPVIVHLFLSNDLLRKIVDTLLSSWQAERVLYKVYRLSSETIKTNDFELLKYFKQNLPSSLRKAVYINQNVLFTSDIGLWVELCSGVVSTTQSETVALSDSEICNDNLTCTNRSNIIYFNLQKLQAETNLDKSTVISLPCYLAPYRLNGKQQCLDIINDSRMDDIMDDIFVVNRKDFYGSKYHDHPLHLSISEKIMAVDSSPPNVWPHVTEYRKSFESDKSFENLLNSLRQSTGFNTMSGAGRNEDLKISLSSPSSSLSSSSSKLPSSSSSSVERHKCQKFVDIAHMKRRTHLFYHCGSGWLEGMMDLLSKHNDTTKSTNGIIDVTLTTALTLDRFSSLERMLDQWKGPAAVLLYVNDIDSSSILDRLIGSSKVLRKGSVRDRVAIHLVHQRLPYNPLNYLRNVLVNNTYTSHVFYVDVDLLPNPDLHDSIVTHLKKSLNDERAAAVNKLFIVPAFQSFVSLENKFPKNKEELLKRLQDETVTGYKQKIGWALGHKPTNYSHWLKAEEPYHAKFEDAFEPYVIVPRDLNARFNEDLLERMGDKIAYTRLIHGMGYDYYVLPRDFVIHLPHSVSFGTLNYFTEENMFKCGSHLFETYRKKLYEMFPNRKF